MWSVVGTALLALASGAGLGAIGSRRMLHGAQAFAVTSVIAVVLTHLLPDAVEALGWPALLVFLLCMAAPHALVQLLQRSPSGSESTLNLAFLGILVHQLGDGLAYAATNSLTTGRGMVLVGQFAHTLPLGLMVMLLARSEQDTRAGWLRIGVLMIATAAGSVLGVGLGLDALTSATPWVSAAVAGLLVHVVLHVQPPSAPPDTQTRTSEVLAMGAGLALAWAGGLAHASSHGDAHHPGATHHHSQVASSLLETGLHTAAHTAPALLLGLVVMLALRHLVALDGRPDARLPTLEWWEQFAGPKLGTMASVLSPATLVLSLLVVGPFWTAAWLLPGFGLRQLLRRHEHVDTPWLGPANAHLAWWGFGVVGASFLLETLPASTTEPPVAAAVATAVVAIAGVPTIAVLAGAMAAPAMPPEAFAAALVASTLQLRGARAQERIPLSILGGAGGWALTSELPPLILAEPLPLSWMATATAAVLVLVGVWQHGLLAWVDALTPTQTHDSA